jgi:D-alanyl-D-alanine carboxypeptidase
MNQRTRRVLDLLRPLVLVLMIGQALSGLCQTRHSTFADTTGMAQDLRIIERKLGPLAKGIRDHLVPIEVQYYSFADAACTVVDKMNLCSGILVVHDCAMDDVRAIFEGLRRDTFPIAKVMPINRYGFNADSTGWNDAASMADNNTSAFNYRRKPTSNNPSKHALGIAIDINPLLNPFVRKSPNGTLVRPTNGRYDPKRTGTLKRGNFMKLLGQRGWAWGGRWPNPVDYQHIEKYKGLCKHLPMHMR